jgi:hypothetical protein
MVVAGSTVHVLNSAASVLTTTLAVKPGDTLVYNKKAFERKILGAMSIVAQGYLYPYPGFQVVTSDCVSLSGADGVQTLDIQITKGCDPFNVVLQQSSPDTRPAIYSYTKDIAFVAAPGPLAQVISDSTWKSPTSLQFTLINEPLDVKGKAGQVSRLMVSPLADNVAPGYFGGMTSSYSFTTGNLVDATLPDLAMPLLFTGTMSNTNAARKNQFHSHKLATDGRTVDFSATALPWITQPILTAADRTVSWTTNGNGIPSMKITTLKYRLGPPGAELFTWQVISPGDSDTKQILPRLPAQLLAQDFSQATSGVAPTVTERLLRFNAGLDYDQVRGNAAVYLPNLSDWSSDPRVTELTVSGE